LATVNGRYARLVCLLTTALVSLLAIPAVAAAADGVGIGGRTDDRKVTYWAFGVMIFFTAFVIVGSVIQMRLESRKERLRQDLERVRRPV
jgi:hypothetical protein